MRLLDIVRRRENKVGDNKIRKLLIIYISIILVAYSVAEFGPTDHIVVTILWVQVEKPVKGKKYCHIKFTSGYNSSGQWDVEKGHISACEYLVSGKTYKVSRTFLMKNWIVNSIVEIP